MMVSPCHQMHPYQANNCSSVAKKQHSEKAKAKGRGSNGTSRIPRPPAAKQNQSPNPGSNKGNGAANPEHRRSIPTAIRKQGEEGHESDQGASGETGEAQGETTEESLAIRCRPLAIVAEPEATESVRCSSEFEDYDADAINAQRPTGFTGENRVRPRTGVELLAQYGARLRIAGSAERLLVGNDDDQARSDGQVSRSLHDHAGQSSFHAGESRSQFGDNQSSDITGDASNFSRPQDILPRANDLSGRERALSRTLRRRPGAIDLENSPPVPKIPEPYASEIRGTPKSERSETTSDNAPDMYGGLVPTVEPFTLDSPLGSHPPRSESLGAQGFSRRNARTQPEGSEHELSSMHQKTETTFDDFVDQSKEVSHGNNAGKMSESKSTRMLDSFRHMFGKKAGVEKGHHSTKNQPADDNTKRVKNVSDSVEYPKTGLVKKTKWSKSARNLRAEDISSPIPMRAPSLMPSPASYSSIPTLARAQHNPNYPTPSFARSTQATRTRAAAASTKQTPPSMETRLRRPQGTFSNGSPQRLARPVRRSPQPQTGTSTTPASQSARSERPQPPEKDAQDAKMADSGEVGIRGVVSCIEDLITKICDSSRAAQREKNLRVSFHLSLT